MCVLNAWVYTATNLLEMTIILESVCIYRLGQKKQVHLELSQKLTNFSNFWYTEFGRNVTSDGYKVIHRTCKM